MPVRHTLMAGLVWTILAFALPLSARGQVPPVFITEWGTTGTGNGQFQLPVGVAVDGQGNVFVVESAGHRVQKFTRDGGFIAAWHAAWPAAVAVDGAGDVYVSESQADSIIKFTNDGVLLAQWGRPGWYCTGLAVDRDGYVYVADGNGGGIWKYTSDGAYVAQWGGTARVTVR
jgi:tripartite motif-containing protein 71